MNVATGLFSIALMGLINLGVADQGFDPVKGASQVPLGGQSGSPTQVPLVKPKFTSLPIAAPFFEQFLDDWGSRWKVSHAKVAESDEWAYRGEWAVEEPTVLKGIEGDKGLVMKKVAARHGISAKLREPFQNADKTLVLQYEVKLQNGLECGGAYIKLLKNTAELHAEEFSNASPYVIMFGPDKCGATNKVHFIFNHLNPKSGKYEEKHLKSPPMAKITKQTTLYTLIVTPDQKFEVRIDGVNAKSGSLLEDFDPPVIPPAEIHDPNDSKPDNWVDDVQIPDPNAKKPADWDENAPLEIEDPDAVMPKDWLENESQYIQNPDAKKPRDWDDEEDGEWSPPDIPNPKCENVSGCGSWKRPVKQNPAYKGPWSPPLIANPAYKGPWAPSKIPNPEYHEDKTPANFEQIGAIGFELWTMTNNILFDNIYLGHSIQDAEKIQKATFDIKKANEIKEEELSAPKAPETPTEFELFKFDPLAYIRSKFDPFMTVAQKDPVAAIKEFPVVAGGIFATIFTLLAILGGLITLASAPSQVKVVSVRSKQKAAAKVQEAGEKIQEVVEKVQEKVQEKAQIVLGKPEGSSSESDNKPKATRRTSKKA